MSLASKFRNAGQVCTAPSRFFVQEALYDRFVATFTERAGSIVVGPGDDPKSKMGPLANARRLEAMESLVADAIDARGAVRTGGRRIGNQGYFFAPTIPNRSAA